MEIFIPFLSIKYVKYAHSKDWHVFFFSPLECKILFYCRFYKGIVPLWGRQIPYTMMKFACFERTVELLYKHIVPKPRSECSKPEQLVVTFAAGYIGKFNNLLKKFYVNKIPMVCPIKKNTHNVGRIFKSSIFTLTLILCIYFSKWTPCNLYLYFKTIRCVKRLNIRNVKLFA